MEGPAWASSGLSRAVLLLGIYTCRVVGPHSPQVPALAGLSIDSPGCRTGILEPSGTSSRLVDPRCFLSSWGAGQVDKAHLACCSSPQTSDHS